MAQCQRHDQSAASWLIVYANGMQLCQSPAVPGTTSQHHTLARGRGMVHSKYDKGPLDSHKFVMI